MSRKRVAAIVAGVVILAAVILTVFLAESGRAADIAVDTTGLSAPAAVSPAASASSRLAVPARAANRIGSTPSPSPAELQQTAVTVVTRPLLVLSPKIVRQGASIGLWGSGFPRGATVDIFLKQKVSDVVDPVTFIQADQNGQFGGVRVTVPNSISPGKLMIQARERQGSLTVAATATVTGADDPQVGTEVGTAVTTPTAGTTATPTAAAAASLTPAAKASPTTVATARPTTVPNVASQPPSAPASKPTDNPRPTAQPTPTPQPKPTEQQPRPTASPQPNPAEQSRAPDTSHTSPYTVQAGDSLSAIAERVYGSADDWKALYDANRAAIGGDPNLIHPGTDLEIPQKD